MGEAITVIKVASWAAESDVDSQTDWQFRIGHHREL